MRPSSPGNPIPPFPRADGGRPPLPAAPPNGAPQSSVPSQTPNGTAAPAPTSLQKRTLAQVPPQQTTQSPEKMLTEATDKFQGVLEEYWCRDQLELITRLIEDPDLATQLGCTLTIRLPGAAKSVGLVPDTGELSEADYDSYTNALCQWSEEALNAKQQALPDNVLYNSYVAYRAEVFKWGRQEAQARSTTFDWEETLQALLVKRAVQQVHHQGVTLTLSRPDPDPNLVLPQAAPQPRPPQPQSPQSPASPATPYPLTPSSSLEPSSPFYTPESMPEDDSLFLQNPQFEMVYNKPTAEQSRSRRDAERRALQSDDTPVDDM